MTDKNNLKNDEFYVEVVDKNFQANLDTDLAIKNNKIINQNQFINNLNLDEYNNKPATPHDEQQEESSDEEPVYKLQKVLPKQNQKQRLIEQNIKLKAQIYQLAKQLDQILQKDRSKKKKFGLNIIEEEDELIREKKLQIKKQQIEIMQLKNKIFVMKRQLDSVYNNFVATQKEDLIKKLLNQLKQLQREKNGLFSMTQQQDKALKTAQNQEEYGEKLQIARNQYLRIKLETREIILKTQEEQKLIKKQHETYVRKLQKLKEIEQKLTLNKQKSKQIKKVNQQGSQSHIQTITEQMIKQLESQIKQLQIRKKEGERQWQQKIKLLDLELYKKRIQEQKKMLILRQKEKELKLNELRIRQLRKIYRQNDIAQKEKNKKDMDMSQFRHKRNIRYIQK